MSDFRYGLALVLIIIMPVVIAFWLTIHAAHPVWKRNPPWVAYTVAGGVLAGVAAVCIWNRTILIGKDLGTVWPLFIAGAAIYIVSLRMSAPVRRMLAFKTFAGIKQLNDEADGMLASGPYAAVRHPRYVMVLVGVLGWAMMAHHVGAYVVAALSVAGMVVVVRLEERELVARFGRPYSDYQKKVPQLVPRWETLRLLF